MQTKKLLASLLLFLALGFGSLKAQTIEVDLQGASIDASPVNIQKDQVSTIYVSILNNGPSAIPTGAAIVTVSLNTAFVNLVTPLNIVGGCGVFTIVSPSIVTATTSSITLKNTGGPMPVNSDACGFTFNVKGIALGTSALNLASSVDVNSPNVSDRNGVNQSATGQVIVSGIVPVQLVEFNAVKAGKVGHLTWSTSSEVNSKEFQVQHSTDNGATWTQLGLVAAKGNSNVTSNYSLDDVSPVIGKNLYRLNMVDLDGSAMLSPVRWITFGSEELSVLRMYPNPVHGYLGIKGTESAKQVVVYDVNGKVVLRENVTGSTKDLYMGRLSAGVYQVQLIGANGTRLALEKVVKD